MSGPRILVVEDDDGLRDVLARGLRAESFDVVTARDGESALRAAAADARLDAVVLDIGLPDSDGRDVCQALRTRGLDAPVLFLTAKGDVGDRLSGFAAGGDDYLAKPFEFRELIARLNAVLRRRPIAAGTAHGALSIDPVAHCLRHGAATARLTPIEYRLLARLMAGRGEVVRRAQLRAAAWPDGAVVSDNTLDQYIAKLRRRINEVGASASIDVVRGVGYELA